ncbi:MAG: S49 family peptidase [Planctomycetes bacterium]|nr:S49 family peptidase [Planctomycetota bacterium]
MNLNAIRTALGPVLAITPDFLREMAVQMGCVVDASVVAAARKPRLPRVAGSIAVIPVTGVLSPRGPEGLLGLLFGGTGMDALGVAVDEMAANEAVGGIVLDIDSPGGTVSGTPELAEKIRQARAVKPVVAVANHTAASGAFWLGSQAEHFYATPSAEVGSVGVLAIFEDDTEAMAKEGIKLIIISAGKYKSELWEQPMGDEAIAAGKKHVDAYYDMFVADLAKGRGVTAAKVRAGFGEGRMVMAADAEAEGMIDGIATLDQVIAGMVKPAPAKRGVPRAQQLGQRLRMT